MRCVRLTTTTHWLPIKSFKHVERFAGGINIIYENKYGVVSLTKAIGEHNRCGMLLGISYGVLRLNIKTGQMIKCGRDKWNINFHSVVIYSIRMLSRTLILMIKSPQTGQSDIYAALQFNPQLNCRRHIQTAAAHLGTTARNLAQSTIQNYLIAKFNNNRVDSVLASPKHRANRW